MERYVPNLEVLNFGVGAYGLDQAYLRYLQDGQQFQSHFVFIGYFPENIFRNVNTFRPFYFPHTGAPLTKPRFVIDEEKLTLIPNPIKKVQDYKKLLLNPQDVLSEIGFHDYYYHRRYKSGTFDWSPTVRLAKIKIQDAINHSSENEDILNAQFRYNEKSEAFKVTKKIFDEFYSTSLNNKSTPIILILPGRTDLINFLNVGIKRYSPLLSYFDSAGYKYIDLMDAFEAAELENLNFDHYFLPHYSPFANDLVAKFILSYLNSLGE